MYSVPVLFTFYIQGVLKLKNNSGAVSLTLCGDQSLGHSKPEAQQRRVTVHNSEHGHSKCQRIQHCCPSSDTLDFFWGLHTDGQPIFSGLPSHRILQMGWSFLILDYFSTQLRYNVSNHDILTIFHTARTKFDVNPFDNLHCAISNLVAVF